MDVVRKMSQSPTPAKASGTPYKPHPKMWRKRPIQPSVKLPRLLEANPSSVMRAIAKRIRPMIQSRWVGEICPCALWRPAVRRAVGREEERRRVLRLSLLGFIL
ncbi:MAG: hypothetical protein H5T70_06750 [Chloroflexi bacterium]|nr:hypothetical protein [Chloroflexota bacterium]